MLYQLPNGKVIEISTEQYIEMSDEELEYLIAYNYGEVMENPWFGSVLQKQDKVAPPEEQPDTIPDLIDLPDEQKLSELDIDFPLEED